MYTIEGITLRLTENELIFNLMWCTLKAEESVCVPVVVACVQYRLFAQKYVGYNCAYNQAHAHTHTDIIVKITWHVDKLLELEL